MVVLVVLVVPVSVVMGSVVLAVAAVVPAMSVVLPLLGVELVVLVVRQLLVVWLMQLQLLGLRVLVRRTRPELAVLHLLLLVHSLLVRQLLPLTTLVTPLLLLVATASAVSQRLRVRVGLVLLAVLVQLGRVVLVVLRLAVLAHLGQALWLAVLASGTFGSISLWSISLLGWWDRAN
jgi:hypothetical protein